MTPTDETHFVASLRHVFTKMRHGFSTRSTSIYAQGKGWITDRRPKETIRHTVHRSVAYLRTTPWQALAIQYKPLLLGLGVLIALLMIWKAPQWQGARWEGRIEPKEVAKQESDTRTAVVQAIVGAALFIGLWFTWRNIRLTEKNIQITQETALRSFESTREGQITDRFTKAIAQLGEVGPDKLAIRLGGIYALERIARDSERDHWPIMEILTAYLRTHARWGKESESQATTQREDDSPRTVEDILEDQSRRRRIGEQEGPRTDIQAILTVVGRRMWMRETEDQRLNLSGLDLRGAELIDAHLERTILVRTHLEEATLIHSHLEGANLRESHLEGAQLIDVHCEGANLAASSFEGILPHVEDASLAGVYMHGANLSNARFRGVDLTGVYGLTQMQIGTACTDKTTAFPDYLEGDTPAC